MSKDTLLVLQAIFSVCVSICVRACVCAEPFESETVDLRLPKHLDVY